MGFGYDDDGPAEAVRPRGTTSAVQEMQAAAAKIKAASCSTERLVSERQAALDRNVERLAAEDAKAERHEALTAGTPASFAAHDLPTRYEYARHRLAQARAAFLLRYPDKAHEFDQVLEGAPAAARRAKRAAAVRK